VLCLNTKRIAADAEVMVSPRQFKVNGYSRDYYPKAVRESSRVEVRLQAVVGAEVAVHPVLVVVGVDLRRYTVKEQPADVSVVTRRHLVRWLQGLPGVLTPAQVQLVNRKLRHPHTWNPPKDAPAAETAAADPAEVPLDRPPAPLIPPPPADLALPAPPEPTPVDVRVAEWKRYGHHRLYVTCSVTDQRLGWRDEKTGEVHVEAAEHAARLRAALAGLADREPGDGQPAARNRS
jgi:hypothetical protein